MADDISIKFTADVSSLQDGMRQAASAMQTTTGTLRAGADQINSSFGILSQASASAVARNVGTVQQSSDATLAIARQNEEARYDIALNGANERSSFIRQQSQTAQIAQGDELSSLLAVQQQKEDNERQNLQSLQTTLQQGITVYSDTQRRIDELASQSAGRRLAIERNVSQQINADFARSLEQIGSSVGSSISGIITAHTTLRDAARNTLDQILQIFIQTKVRMVTEWLSGILAQTAASQTSEAAKTAAVTAGVAARASAERSGATASMSGTVGAILKAITASAGETFAGIFGFLSPVMGPAAAGPAAAGEAAVLSVGAGLASFATGAWNLPSDMIAQVHQGEMIIPAGPAAAFRANMEGNNSVSGTVHVHHATNFNVSTLDARSFDAFLKNNGKRVIRAIHESVRTGSHLGLSRLGSAV